MTILLSLAAIGCGTPRLRSTVELKCHLYVEDFIVSNWGVDEQYLTDSASVRVYMGRLDLEHEAFVYVCNGDSVILYHRREGDDGRWQILDSFFVSRETLKENTDNRSPFYPFP